MQRFTGASDKVTKYTFEFGDAIAEAVLYRYKQRTVICCSVQSGCPVGCVFCGTGRHFIRNLTAVEIVQQVRDVVADAQVDTSTGRFQIMFMSMGEPMLNWLSVEDAIWQMDALYPTAELLISTVGIGIAGVLRALVLLSEKLSQVGLQFSIHESSDGTRNIAIPFFQKLNLVEIGEWGRYWMERTKRPVFLNYCVHDGNCSQADADRLVELFPPSAGFHFTLSVICNKDKGCSAVDRMPLIQDFQQKLLAHGYNVRVFDPDGQDDIGGGCGQLWYTQEWLQANAAANKCD